MTIELNKPAKNDNLSATLQVIWEQLNGALYDLTQEDYDDAQEAIQDCINRLETHGIGVN